MKRPCANARVILNLAGKDLPGIVSVDARDQMTGQATPTIVYVDPTAGLTAVPGVHHVSNAPAGCEQVWRWGVSEDDEADLAVPEAFTTA